MRWKNTRQLLDGSCADDDAAVVRSPAGDVLISTVDVFTPVVDDPYVFGQIAAVNSLSDVYAMGGTPMFALSILGYPPHVLPPEVPAAIIQGAVDKVAEAGAVLAGGHTIRSSEVLFGLSVVGQGRDGQVLRKRGARPGDLMVLTKPLGIGVYTTALKRGRLDETGRKRVTALMLELNGAASAAAVNSTVSACTDVTGFGFLGHLAEMARASEVSAVVFSDAVPLLEEAKGLAREGFVPGGSLANLAFLSDFVSFSDGVDHETKVLLADAQTSGGLIVALPPTSLAVFQEDCARSGQDFHVVGGFESGPPRLFVTEGGG